jgi:hypothetical protein
LRFLQPGIFPTVAVAVAIVIIGIGSATSAQLCNDAREAWDGREKFFRSAFLVSPANSLGSEEFALAGELVT